jgi:membrane protease YdiL (CAAX protease family)
LSSEGMWAAVRSFHPWGKVAIMAVGGLAAPICEEVFFRGGCYGSFAGAGLPRAGSWVSALLFSMAHFNLENAVAYLTIGLVLAWLYRSTRSLVAPIVAHAVNNTAAFALLFLSGT